MDAHQQSPGADDRPRALERSQVPPERRDPVAAGDPGLEALRDILARPDRERAASVTARVEALEHRTSDPSELVAAISPLMGDIIRRKIQDNRAEMIETLYPIIGQLIGRGVAEAIRDLARAVDARMRTSLDLKTIWRRFQGRMAGIPDTALALRDALPFRVAELFLIHRESGLLLQYLTNEPETADQADLVSGMLTAIRDFARDAFGRGQEGQLDEIQYGTRRILVEASQHAYLAVVVDGIEPHGFRETMRQRIIAIENAFIGSLVRYDGDATRFATAEPDLTTLLVSSTVDRPVSSTGLSAGQRRIVLGLGVVLVLCLLVACVGSVLALRNALDRPTTTVMIVVTATPGPTFTPTATAWPTQSPTATITPTAMPTATATPTATSTASPTATPTPTSSPTPAPSPIARVLDRPVNIRSGPGLTYAVLEVAVSGRELVIVGRNALGSWWQVCCTLNGANGWIASALVQIEGLLSGVPVTSAE